MSTTTLLPKEKLEEMKTSDTIEVNASTKAELSEADARQLAAIIRENHNLKELTLDTQLTPESAKILAEGLQGHPSLTSFRLKRQELPMSTIRTLTDTTLALPQLEYFQLKDCQLTTAEIRYIAQNAREHPTLSGLCLSKNTVDAQSAEALADMLDKKRNFQYIRLMDCELSDDSMVLLASRAAKQPDMVHFHLHYNPVSGRAAEEVPRLMLAGGGLNLCSCLPYNDQSNRYCMNNSTIAKQLIDQLAEAHTQHRGEDINTHAQAYARFASIKLMRRATTTNELTQWDKAQAYMESLPVLDDSLDIMRTDDRGLCPAENPAIWQDAEATLQRLEQGGITIDRAWLEQKTPRGDSLLSCAMTADAHAVLPALNRRGIQVQMSDLVDSTTRQPSSLLQNMVQQNTCSALFRKANWAGGRAEEARTVLRALPAEARNRLENTYQLLARLDSEQQASVGRGR